MKRILAIILLAFAGFSCTDTIEQMTPPVSQEESAIARTVMQTRSASSFSTLPNPYALGVMQEVYNELVGNVTLSPTDLYVRFLPQDSLQMNRLKYDYNLELFDHPLDMELEEGDVYVDPTIPENSFMWQYTTVKPNFVFPSGITYQILEQCYIPSDNTPVYSRSGGIADIEGAAFAKVGYTVEPETRSFLERERPEGTITVLDTEGSGKYVPVKGIKVRCHTLVKWSTAYTDENGHYVMQSRFRIGPHYGIVFDNCKGFDIWANWGPLSRANYSMGWHSKSGYDKQIGQSSIFNSHVWICATVNNAGYEYYKMCEQTGIRKPPANLKIWIADLWSDSAVMMRRVWHPIGLNGNSSFGNFLLKIGTGIPLTVLNTVLKLVEPDITLSAGSHSSRMIYNRVNHELSHASHFSQVGSAFWAKYISYILTYGAYGDGTGNNAELVGIGEMWGYTMGNWQECEEYNIDELEDSYPGGISGIDGWIKPHVFWDLLRNNTLTKKQIYDCLTSDVDTYAKLATKMYEKYPPKAAEIRDVFVSCSIPNIPDVPVPALPYVPVISVAKVRIGNDVRVTVSVDNPNQGALYEWEMDDWSEPGCWTHSVTYIGPFDPDPGAEITMRCRAYLQDGVSEWSNEVLVPPFSYMILKKSLEES